MSLKNKVVKMSIKDIEKAQFKKNTCRGRKIKKLKKKKKQNRS